MRNIALCFIVAIATVSTIGCHAQVKVQAKAETPPPPPPEPAPAEPPPPAPVAGGQVVLPGQIDFDFNDSRINETAQTMEILDKLADLMKKHPEVTKLRIEGHTDNVGSKKLNSKLSKARADAVAKWLSGHEVEEKRLVTIGYGSKRPLKPNDSEANRALNRRTEYYVEELDGKKVEGDGKSFESEAKPEKVAAGTTSGGKSGAN
jgi:outer membrane protein OmpA-like peptidoglycan-associated protein